MAKRKLHVSERPTSWSTTAILLATTCASWIAPAKAEIDLSAGAAIGVEHDSNPLELSNSQAQNFLTNGYITSQDDTVKRLTANVAAKNGINGPTHLQLQAKYSKVSNEHFRTLDHTEYNFGGNLDWKPSQVFDASLQASENRAPVGINEVGGQLVVQQTSRLAEATLRLRPTPHWQLSLTPRWYDNTLPLPGAENFKLRESSVNLALGYLGAGALVPGLAVTETRGRYSGVDFPTRYKQQSIGVTLNYKVTDFSIFNLFVGHTQRTTRLIEPTNNLLGLSREGTQPAYTGTLGYQRQLSVKTRIGVDVFRDFQQYEVGVNTQIGTGFNGEVNWAATAKLSMRLNARLVRSTISALQTAGSIDDRKDLERSYSLSGRYLATRNVSLRPYFTRRLHNSTTRSAVFDKTVAGLELTVTID